MVIREMAAVYSADFSDKVREKENDKRQIQ